jgi:hypothetical protein
MTNMNNENYNDKFYDRILALAEEGKSVEEMKELLGNGRQVREALLALEVLQFTREALPDSRESFDRLMNDVTDLHAARYISETSDAPSRSPFTIIDNLVHYMKSRTWIFSAAAAMAVVVVVVVSVTKGPGLPEGDLELLAISEHEQKSAAVAIDTASEVASLEEVSLTTAPLETVAETPAAESDSLDGLLASLDDVLVDIEEDSGTEDLIAELTEDLSGFDEDYDF